MSLEQNKAVARRDLEEVWSNGNLAVADELHTPDCVRHDLGASASQSGIEGLKQAIAGYQQAFPDLHFTVEDMIGEEEKLAIRWTVEATHTAEFNGIPATGKKVKVAGISICYFRDGKIAEDWASWDALGLMKQLGVIPG